jgi:superfamily II DNA or RNA helicase
MALYGNVGPIVYNREIKEQVEAGALAQLEIEMHNIDCGVMPVKHSYSDIYDTIKIDKIPNKLKYNEMLSNGYEVYQDKYLRQFVEYGNESTHYVYNEIRNKKIVELALKNDHVMILVNRKEHGEILKNLLITKKANVIYVNGDNITKERNDAKDFLKEDKCNILIASTIFGQGTDIPWIHTLILAGGGKGTVPVIQRFGRITRKHTGTNKEIGKVIDLYDDFSPLGKKQSERRKAIYEGKLGFKVKLI